MSELSAVASNRRSIPSLDGLRAISVILVMLAHLRLTAGWPKNAMTATLGQFAQLGVQIFFVISGFLITTLLVQERAKNGSIDVAQFYLRRTFRIFPAAFFYVTIMAIVLRPSCLVYAYTYTICYVSATVRPWVLGHLWSLSVEEQFYLLWPAMLIFGWRWRRQIGFTALLIAPVARALFWHAKMHAVDEYFPGVMDTLMLGCLLAFYRDTLRRRFAWLTHPVAFAALGVLMTWANHFYYYEHIIPRARVMILLYALSPVFITLFLFAAIERADWILNNTVTRALGILSYSLYLWQQPFLNRFVAAWWTKFPVNVILALVCATISYWAVERPFLRFYHSRKQTTVIKETVVAPS